MAAITAGSLFSGIGGFDLGFADSDIVTRWQVEKDDAAREVLARHFPEAARYGDVCDVNGHELAPVDVVTAGFPCQDLSVAGARAGLAGARSGLFHEIIRVVREMREATNGAYPKHVVLENVPGLLSSHDGRDFAVVLGELAGLGAMDVAWRVLDAQFFGVAQRRRRVFVVARFGDGAGAAEILFEREGGGGHPPPRRTAGEGVAARLTRGSASGRGVNEPGRRREDDVNLVPVAFGGNNTSGPIAVAAGLNAKGGTGRMDFESETFLAFTQNQRDEVRDLGDKAGALAAEPGSHQQNYIAFDMKQVTSVANRQRIEAGRPAPTLTQDGGAHAIPPSMAVRRLTPTECARLQAFPDWWLDGVSSDSAKYRMLGNAVCTAVAAWLGQRIVARTTPHERSDHP